MRSLRSDLQHGLKQPHGEFQWPLHAALLRKLSKVVDIKTDSRNTTVEMNGSSDLLLEPATAFTKKPIMLADVSVNTGKSLNEDQTPESMIEPVNIVENEPKTQISPERTVRPEEKKLVVSKDNVTVEIQHSITPKKSSLKLDLKKGTSQLSASLLNISSQIKSVTTHKRIVSTTGPKKPPPLLVSSSKTKEEAQKVSNCQSSTPKSAKSSRPLVNTKSPNVLIYSDSVIAKDNLEASLRQVLDCDR